MAHYFRGLQCDVAGQAMTTAVIRRSVGTDFCLMIMAHCLVAGLLDGFETRWKFVFLIPS